MQNDISLKALRYFMAAVREGSIAEAAKVVNVVPSAVHTAIKQVEAAFGLKLTLRSPSRGVTLTATGQQMVPRMQNLLDDYASLLRVGGDMRTQLSGAVRIGYYAPAAPGFLPAIVKPLLADHVDVAITFVECDNESAQAGLLSGAYDAIVCVAEAMKPGITYETLLEIPAYVLVPAAHSFAARASVALADLAEQNLVLLDRPVVSEYYSAQFDRAGIKPRIAATATSLEMVRSLVGHGVGCSLLHMVTASDTTYAGHTVAAVPLAPAIEPFSLVVGHLADNPRRLVEVVVDGLRAHFQHPVAQALRVTGPSTPTDAV
ncbi:MAG: LysR family transcriptional regulator [Pseudomonadota bacterium]